MWTRMLYLLYSDISDVSYIQQKKSTFGLTWLTIEDYLKWTEMVRALEGKQVKHTTLLF